MAPEKHYARTFMVGLVRTRGRLLCTAVAVVCFIVLGFIYLPAGNAPKPTFLSQSATSASDISIPRHIWQIFFPPKGTSVLDKSFLYSDDWISMAPGYTYTLVGDAEAAAIIDQHFADRPEIAATYNALRNPALKSDFLRYLILLAKGGTYSDVDTKPLVPLDDWILDTEHRAAARLVVAVEYDEAQHAVQGFTYPVQFCQWTIAAAPDHAVLARMVDRALAGLRDVAANQSTALDGAAFSDFDVLNTTGPIAWTEVVFRALREADPSIESYADLAGIRSPRYYGDIVVLPLESFKADFLDDWGWTWLPRVHRGLVRHFFKGAWRSES
jgi:alpha 1,6-mannosyltransferase